MDQYIIDVFHRNIGTFKNGKSPPIFPGPQPISVERKHFQTLKNNNYVVCEKTDGVRHALVCARFNGTNVSALLNRALQVRIVNIKLPDESYSGTILDGELVGNDIFIVYDAMTISGEDIMHQNFLKRLEKIGNLISIIKRNKTDTIKIKIKNFFISSDINELLENYIPKLKYKTDGIIFTPVDEVIKLGTHESMFKWKPRDTNTIDFQLKWRSNKWGLYIQDRGILIFQSELPHDNDNEWLIEDNIVECQYMVDEIVPWWKPVGLRTDKHHPNNRRTFYRTLANIRENIKIDEFIKLFNI